MGTAMRQGCVDVGKAESALPSLLAQPLPFLKYYSFQKTILVMEWKRFEIGKMFMSLCL